MTSTKVLYECSEGCGYVETEQQAADRSYAEDCPNCRGVMMGADE